MTQSRTFQSQAHEATFHELSRLYQRGAPTAPICGARLRTGAVCSNPPIREGKGRCLSHAGPHAARAFRERQKRRFEAGSISAAEWNRAEARRAANRLGDKWKKDPWWLGSTIDLAEHEPAFRRALGGLDVDALAPAVADWLRWRYRRTQIDTQNDKAWMKARTQDLPARVTKAGQRPVERRMNPTRPATAPKVWSAADGQREGSTRRSLSDQAKAPRVVRGKGYARPGRPRTQPAGADEFEELMRVYRENVAVLEPMIAQTQGEAKQLAVLRTLRDYLARPGDVGACKRWIALVEAAQIR